MYDYYLEKYILLYNSNAALCLCRLGLAYAGSNREDVLSLLLPVMGDSKSSMEVRVCLQWMSFLVCLCVSVFDESVCEHAGGWSDCAGMRDDRRGLL